MIRIIIVCEGQTEREFCRDVLGPWLLRRGVIAQYPIIKHTGGGIVKWERLKQQLEHHLKSEKSAYVTTFIDFYGITERHKFPGFGQLPGENTLKRVARIQEAMNADLEEAIRYRFLPYIQLYEFEALLFSNVGVIFDNFSAEEMTDSEELNRIVAAFHNPEEINNSYETAPSKRLSKIIVGYNKVIYGAMLAEEIGLETIMDRCPGFKNWVDRILTLATVVQEE
ncbi:MAG: DUF4276 family protein [Lewinella sp.]